MEIFSNLHPKFVHFPIAFFLLYTVLECIYAATGREFFSKTAHVLLTLGVIGSLLTLFTGDQAALAAGEVLKNAPEKMKIEIQSLIDLHNDAATMLVWVFTGLLVYRSWFFIQTAVKKKTLARHKMITLSFVIIALIGCVFLYQTSLQGGNLVYKYGVGSELFKNLLK